MTSTGESLDGGISILLAVQQSLIRDGIRKILETHHDFVVVGEADDGDSAIGQAADKNPEVIICDVIQPSESIVSVVGAIRRVAPGACVIILGMGDSLELVKALLGVGISGYLLMSVTEQEFVSAVRGARSDGLVSMKISRQAIIEMNNEARSGQLSERERAILELTAQAMSNAQIAQKLSVAEATVKRHMSNIFVKLGAVSRIDAVNKAAAASLISVPIWNNHD
jgi:DNA-binding NarL/FixJ family response regulator